MLVLVRLKGAGAGASAGATLAAAVSTTAHTCPPPQALARSLVPSAAVASGFTGMMKAVVGLSRAGRFDAVDRAARSGHRHAEREAAALRKLAAEETKSRQGGMDSARSGRSGTTTLDSARDSAPGTARPAGGVSARSGA